MTAGTALGSVKFDRFYCSECGDRLEDDYPLNSYCSHDCYVAARDKHESVFEEQGIDPPPFPRIGHYPDATGVGEWTPDEMQDRIDELREMIE